MEYLIALGSNLGDRQMYLERAEKLLSETCGAIKASSRIYKTEPWGFESDDWFFNKVIILDAELKPSALMRQVQKIESIIGRDRGKDTQDAYSSRSIDIDVVLADDLVIDEPGLKVPHPSMHLRNFVLLPASEIAEDWKHPVLHLTIGELCRACKDKGQIAVL